MSRHEGGWELVRPSSAAEVDALLADREGAVVLAGGTDLLPNLRHGIGAPRWLVDIALVPGLDDIADRGVAGLRLGAATRLGRIAADPVLGALYPALAEAAGAVAGPAHRSVATLGGNLCVDTRCVYYNQSEWWRRARGYCMKHRGSVCHVAPDGKRCHAAYSGDLAPALIALGATVHTSSRAGSRTRAIEDLFAEDGAAPLRLAAGEWITGVDLPYSTGGLRSGYRKARSRAAIDFPLAGVAVSLLRDGERLAALRIAISGTQSRPILLEGTQALVGSAPGEEEFAELGRLVQRQVRPMRTTTTPGQYRRLVAAALTERLARELWGAAAA